MRFRARARDGDVATAFLSAILEVVPGDVAVVAPHLEMHGVRCSDEEVFWLTRECTKDDMMSHPGILHRYGQAVTVSDRLSLIRWRRTACYQKTFRVLGMVDDLGIDIRSESGPPLVQACVMRAGWRKFSDEERALLTLLAGHYPAAHREAETAIRTRLSLQSSIEGAMNGGVIFVDERARVTAWSEQTRSAVARVFGLSLKAAKSLPPELRDWLGVGSATPFLRTGGGRRAEFIFLPDPAGGGVIVVRGLELDVPIQCRLLTPREREIAGWAARGLRNAEIATRLAVSPGTVKRHLENIFGKLGVRNRLELTLWAQRAPDSP